MPPRSPFTSAKGAATIQKSLSRTPCAEPMLPSPYVVIPFFLGLFFGPAAFSPSCRTLVPSSLPLWSLYCVGRACCLDVTCTSDRHVSDTCMGYNLVVSVYLSIIVSYIDLKWSLACDRFCMFVILNEPGNKAAKLIGWPHLCALAIAAKLI